MTRSLFDEFPQAYTTPDSLAPGAAVLRGFACAAEGELLHAIAQVAHAAPPRRMTTPGGRAMSVAMTNCGALGWVSSAKGYRYEPCDPLTGQPWPAMPACLLALAAQAAHECGFDGFTPDACLINHYAPGTRLALHQDRDEVDFSAPIVSVSLGLPATFLFGGLARTDAVQRLRLAHGDVVVWGGPSRLAFHGVAPLADGTHAALGRQRINLTFRRAGPASA